VMHGLAHLPAAALRGAHSCAGNAAAIGRRLKAHTPSTLYPKPYAHTPGARSHTP
jgi:hypothetical protein